MLSPFEKQPETANNQELIISRPNRLSRRLNVRSCLINDQLISVFATASSVNFYILDVLEL